MKYCPKCQAEYKDEIPECADCQEKLVCEPPLKRQDEIIESGDNAVGRLGVFTVIGILALFLVGAVAYLSGYYSIGSNLLFGAFIVVLVLIFLLRGLRIIQLLQKKSDEPKEKASFFQPPILILTAVCAFGMFTGAGAQFIHGIMPKIDTHDFWFGIWLLGITFVGALAFSSNKKG